MKVICYVDSRSTRSKVIAKAMAAGIEACGDQVMLSADWIPVAMADCAVGYGWRYPDVFEAYREAGSAFVYIDLGWWERKPHGNEMGGYHKVVVNEREPMAYFRRGSASDRFARFGLSVQPWRSTGSHILLGGMSAKSAKTRGYAPQEWERDAIRRIREVSDRPIWYRPKPSWGEATPIEATRFSGPGESIAAALRDCWAVVTLHSNVAVDALLAGVPVHCQHGVGAALSVASLAEIEAPALPEGRERLMADIAYVQWSVAEMRSGECWAHLKRETPLCG